VSLDLNVPARHSVVKFPDPGPSLLPAPDSRPVVNVYLTMEGK
jgi:hypothetical protein